ncbi:TIR domain-containing protein [Phycicoccus sonneratiae]|uniref:Nucleotide-binding protein n=1 Tax=Phycicoccus sonneratiae TaxID=2807628 RepID=A0ABS2CSB4_9MICO|nr:TIR domain-containing protein [Phycicoccus sonneraticus]MBM6402373.1 nucleotide-binding protein [Phycicoccus sonneraticus]
MTLQKSVRVPQALADNYASHPTRPLDVASALDMTPSSGPFRRLCGAAVGYGLTDGGPNAPTISLTKMGARVVTPTEVDDDKKALRDAALKPSVANKFYTRYDGSPLPPKNIAQNVLATFDVPTDRTGDVYELLIENARFVGFLKTIKDKEYIDIGGPIVTPVENQGHDEDLALDDDFEDEEEAAPPATEQREERREHPPTQASQDPAKNAIFLGHGGNKKPMEQLIKVLNEYKIPYKAAVEEPNRARPIPQKVRETMQECGAAILVFTADKEYFDADGNSIWRPSENVSHELGAASVLYGERIVVFKEKGIDLASNFSSVGYIEFEKDKLSDKGLDLFRELVSMGILKFSVG